MQLNTTRTGRLKRSEVHQGSGPPVGNKTGRMTANKLTTFISGDGARKRPSQHDPACAANVDLFKDAGAALNRFTTPAIGGSTTTLVAGAQGKPH